MTQTSFAAFRGQDVDLYRRHLSGTVPVLSFASVGELHYGAVRAGWGECRRQSLEEVIRRYVVAPYNEEVAKLWGTLKAQAANSGHPLGQPPRQMTCGSRQPPSTTMHRC